MNLDFYYVLVIFVYEGQLRVYRFIFCLLKLNDVTADQISFFLNRLTLKEQGKSK